MKHPDASCDCGQAVNPLALRWRCPVCGRTAIIKVAALTTVCDGDTIRAETPRPGGGISDQAQEVAWLGRS
jgi:hypothetical protein